MVESVGRAQSYIVSYTYNDKGLVSQIVTKKGLLSFTESLNYDNHNRILSDNLSTGKLTTYVYNNRIVTSTSSGRTYTTETDALGNTIRSTDPLGHDVEYTYCSNGKPGKITANGISTLFEYDNSGNQTSIIDPDAGKTIYTYAADGKILTQTDSRGIKTVNTYDVIGRVTSTMVGNTMTTYTYGTSDNAAMQLVKSSMNDNSIEYEYDQYGRKTKETRTVADHGSYTFDYAYNTLGQLSSVTFPGNLVVTYGYDDSGFLTSTRAGLDKVYSLVYDNGKSYRYCFKGKVCATSQYDDRGYLTESNLIAHDATSDELTSSSDAITVYDKITSEYQSTTGNLTLRQRFGQNAETFEYDDLDRLTKVYKGGSLAMQMTYDASGNITSKTSIGAYTYNTLLPHAVAAVENSSLLIPLNALSTSYNDINKISTINGGSDSTMTFTYGPDNQRWYTQIVHGGNIVRNTVYADSYEKVVDNGITREYYYLDGNTIVIKENGTFKSYIALTDNQRNILSVIDENGTKYFDSDYDPWGKQTIRVNTIGLHRGYTGHEMLNEFGIINMNGRLYDPVLGRFFSPDNYIQECDNLQNFNRYSYCLNNPLKLIDPTGNLFGIDDAIIFGVVSGAMMGAMNAAMHNDKIWAGALVGGVIGGVTGWASGAMASFSQANNIWAGALVGAGTGASIGATSSFLSVGFNNLLNGRNFSENLWSSVGSSAFTGGVTGAISGGIKAYESCRERNINPFTGKEINSYSNIVEGRMQPDPSGGCYRYAAEYACNQVGKPHTAESIGAACDNADGMDVWKVWHEKMICNVSSFKRSLSFPADDDLSQFAGAFARGKMTAELTISIPSSSTNHVVTLNKFDTVTKHSWFGTGMHTVMSRIHVFDPLTGNTERFYGNLKVFDFIH